MKFNVIYFMYFNYFLFFLNCETGSFAIYQPLKREFRFSKIDAKFVNQYPGVVLEKTFKQYGHKQTLFLHIDMKKKITDFSAKIGVYKCKEYYIDCINVISYDITNACSKLNAIMFFFTITNDEAILKKCPIHGEYKYNNVSIELDKFTSSFSIPTEKWWEYYWKWKTTVYNESKSEIFAFSLDFYFLQFRSRKTTLF